MDTTNSFEIPYVDPGDPQREFPPLNKQAMEIIDAALFEQAGAIQDLDAAIGTTETAITAERAARETAILAEQTARQQADTALTTALAGKITGTGMTLRRDTTVGERILLDHPGGTTMLMGDTGWRNITDRLINGWTAGPSGVVIRRVMDRVYLEAIGLNGTAATSAIFITLPVGWSIGTWTGRRIQIGGKSSLYGAGARSLSLPVGETHFLGTYELAEFSTPDAWPSAQAGTPINHG